jgi:hypothetical protein
MLKYNDILSIQRMRTLLISLMIQKGLQFFNQSKQNSKAVGKDSTLTKQNIMKRNATMMRNNEVWN